MSAPYSFGRFCVTRVLAAVSAATGLVGCSGPPPPPAPIAMSRSAIAYGNADARHTAVVAVLAPASANSFEECTGSIVKMQGDVGYVLTAAHCCKTYVPTIVVVSNDYAVGENAVFGSPAVPPVYSVVAGSVYYDAQYAASGGQLKFSGASSSTPALALPSAPSDGLSLGGGIEHIGFGQTETSTTNSGRRTGTDTVDQQLTDLILQFSQGGAQNIPGTCDGDSGGPALLPAGGAQGAQVVVGVQSYGNASTCTAETLGVSSRVLSAIGTGKFITSYLAEAPIGTHAGAAPAVPASPRWTLLVMVLVLGTAGSRSRRALRERIGGRQSPAV